MIIHNGADPLIFNNINRINFNTTRKIRLIATSWSDNWKKGFHLYKWLDSTLDFKKYDFTFIGNSPVKFKNVHHINPLPSEELSMELKKHDIYITGSESDPCSNSLIEALSCGLPAVVKNDGGHPELVKGGGITFNTKKECLKGIFTIVNDYKTFQKNIDVITIEDVANEYYKMMNEVCNLYIKGEYQPKEIYKNLYYHHIKLQLKNKINRSIRMLYQIQRNVHKVMINDRINRDKYVEEM